MFVNCTWQNHKRIFWILYNAMIYYMWSILFLWWCDIKEIISVIHVFLNISEIQNKITLLRTLLELIIFFLHNNNPITLTRKNKSDNKYGINIFFIVRQGILEIFKSRFCFYSHNQILEYFLNWSSWFVHIIHIHLIRYAILSLSTAISLIVAVSFTIAVADF